MVGPVQDPGAAGLQVVFAVDLLGRCTMSTGPGLQARGLEPGDLVGQDMYASYHDVEALRRALTGESFTCDRRVDGRLLHTCFSPVRAGDGALEGTVAVELDVTEQAETRKELATARTLLDESSDLVAVAEAAARAARAELVRFRALVEASADFIAIAGLDGRVLYVNPAGRALVGMDPAVDVTTTTIKDYLTPEGIERSEQIEQPAVVAHGRWEGESTLKGVRGRPVPVEIASFLMPDPDTGEPFALATVQHDITERLAARLAHEDFITLVAHELRTPLASVKGYVEIASDALEETADASDVTNHLVVVTRNVERMERLVEQILRIAASERGALSATRHPVDLVHVVELAVQSARPAVEAAGLRFRLVTGPPVTVHLDEHFAEVLDNLVANAAQYTPVGGEVRVSVAREGEEAVVRVSDTGPGIAPDERDAIFEKFTRGESVSHQTIPGVGLGLYIARAIVDSHDGDILVEEAPGGGALFSVHLPVT